MDCKKKDCSKRVSRRLFMQSAASLGLAGLSVPSFAQTVLDAVVNDGGRANWGDQFDSRFSRITAKINSNTPVLSEATLANLQQAIFVYQDITNRGGWPQVVIPRSLRIGDVDPSVQVLRERLILSYDLDKRVGISSAFDSYVDGAVRNFQARHGLLADGILEESTIQAMNIPAEIRLQQLNKNYARLQALVSGNLGQRYVMVNIPAAYIEAVQDGSVVLRNTAIVGKIDRQTPILNSEIYQVILNPFWVAPRSIVQKDIMPLMRQDPTYLKRNNIRLVNNKGVEIPPEQIDWNAPKAPNLMFRQDPGKINAMSSTKINFMNPYSVYMHDTPQRGLFNKIMRFETSGCVRVSNVRDLNVWLLSKTPGWTRQRMERVIESRVNTPIKLANKVPIHFVYISAWSSKDHVVQLREDIYNLDGNSLAPNSSIPRKPIPEEDFLSN
ncbi:amidase [Liberibacter crescens]|nr:amidase [Liberibacter crescens]